MVSVEYPHGQYCCHHASIPNSPPCALYLLLMDRLIGKLYLSVGTVAVPSKHAVLLPRVPMYVDGYKMADLRCIVPTPQAHDAGKTKYPLTTVSRPRYSQT